MKGGKFNISVFVGVAIVALIRDLLVATLKHEEIGKLGYFLAGAILILGIVYYLVTKAEIKREEGR
jgi:phosphate starvation-inducible membrane PsiE